MLLDHLPESPRIRRSWRALVHHRGCPIGQWAIHDVAVTGDPAHIRCAPVHVVVAEIEDPLKREMGPKVVTSGGVHHTLGFASRSGRVEHEESIFALHRLGRTITGLAIHQPMPPLVTTLDHLHGLFGALHHQHGGHRWTGAIGEGRINGRFQ